MTDTSNNCPLCSSVSVSDFSKANNKIYYSCSNCGLIFLDERFFLPPEEEKERYVFHNNDPADERYIEHIKTLTDRLVPFLKSGDTGLDYGSGHGKPVNHILGELGYPVKSYDPFFHRHENLLKEKYDFITCTETAEHFHKPCEEFTLLSSMLSNPGILGIMTNIYSNDINFDDWWYPRDPTHVCFYSEETFEWIAKRYNLVIIESDNNVILFRKSDLTAPR